MKRRIAATAVFLLGIAGMTALSGCTEEKAAPLSKADATALHAPLGQPMPPEAKAFMEKAGREAQEKQKESAKKPAGEASPATPGPSAPK